MKKLFILFTFILGVNVMAQNNVIINTTDYHNIVTSDNGNILALHTDYDIDYDFIFTKKEIRIIKNFTGDILTDIYNVKNYKVVNGIVQFKTDKGNIELDITNNIITIEISKNNYTCYYLDNENNDAILTALNN